MTVQDQIDQYIAGQPPSKRDELGALNRIILGVSPGCELWFLDGRNDQGKAVSNPNIGYGSQLIQYVNGESRAFYRVGLSANTSGISIYVMGVADKTFLARTYGERLGKAKITGYCIKVKSIKDLDLDVLEELFANHLREDATGTTPVPIA